MSEELLTAPALTTDSNARMDFRSQMTAATPVAFVTPLLVALNVIVFFAMVFHGISFFQPTAHEVLPWGANFGPLTVSGQWWRLLAACFIHFGIVHIAVNMYVLLQVGAFTERLFGNLRFALIYLLAGIFGNIAGLFFHPFAVGAGASGAIFGIFGALLAFLLIQRGVVPRRAANGIALAAGLFVLYNLIYGIVRPQTDQVAHIGGILTGFIAGCVLARPLAPAAKHVGAARAAAVALTAALLGMIAVRHVPKPNPEQADWYTKILTAPLVTLGHNDRVAYLGSATRADAQRIAQALMKDGLFQPADVVVLLERNASGATLSVPIRADTSSATKPWDDPAVLASFHTMGQLLATAAGGPPLTIRLLTQDGIPKAKVAVGIGEVVVGERDRVLYSGTIKANQAAAMGVALEQAGFFQGRGAVVIATRKSANSVSELTFVVPADASVEPQLITALQQVGLKVSPAIGGPPLLVRVVDATGQVRSEQMVR